MQVKDIGAFDRYCSCKTQVPTLWAAFLDMRQVVNDLSEKIEKLSALQPSSPPEGALAGGVAGSPASDGRIRPNATPSQIAAPSDEAATNNKYYPEPPHVRGNPASRRAWQKHCNTLGFIPTEDQALDKICELPMQDLYRPNDLADLWACPREQSQAWAYFGSTYCWWDYDKSVRSNWGWKPRERLTEYRRAKD